MCCLAYLDWRSCTSNRDMNSVNAMSYNFLLCLYCFSLKNMLIKFQAMQPIRKQNVCRYLKVAICQSWAWLLWTQWRNVLNVCRDTRARITINRFGSRRLKKTAPANKQLIKSHWKTDMYHVKNTWFCCN